jgi:transcriptional regulator with XRE-family HTH domain
VLAVTRSPWSGCPVVRWTSVGRLRLRCARAGPIPDGGRPGSYTWGHPGTLADKGAAVVDAVYTGDLDLAAAATPAELTALLRTVHLRADRPSLRALEARTRHDPTPLSKTVVSELLKGVRFPRKTVMVAFLRACGERDDRIESWQRAWDRIAAQRLESAAHDTDHAPTLISQVGFGTGEVSGIGAAEVERLRQEVSKLGEDNRRLRLQINGAGPPGLAPEMQPADQASTRAARGPEVRRRELAAQLRSLRSQRSMTTEQVAGHLFCSVGKVSRMENGFRAGTVRDIRDLCDLYEVSDAQRDYLMDLARQSKQHGWWQDYDLPFSTYIGLEADAASISSYHCVVVPGLLQTADYACAVVNVVGRGRGLNQDAIEQRVQIRLTRQRVLTQEDPPKLIAVMDEAVLHRVVGSATVMARQMDRLIELSRLENVDLRIINYGAGCHPGVGGSFDLLKFGGDLPGMVYVEGLFGVIYVEKAADVDRYQSVFETLHETAKDQEESRKEIIRIRSRQKDIL